MHFSGKSTKTLSCKADPKQRRSTHAKTTCPKVFAFMQKSCTACVHISFAGLGL